MTKDSYIAAHEELIEEYLEENPDATEQEAYDATAEDAYDRMIDKYTAKADYIHDVMKGN